MPIDARDGKRKKSVRKSFLDTFLPMHVILKNRRGDGMGVDFEQEIREIFGTTDLTALREISKAANEYQHMVEKSVRKQASGRKNSFTEPQIARILALQSQGEKITSIAKQYQVSRQTIYSQIQRAHQFSDDPDVRMREFYESGLALHQRSILIFDMRKLRFKIIRIRSLCVHLES